MSELYYFSPEQTEIARRTNLVELLRSQGEQLKPSGSEYEWLCRGQKVTIRRNLWYHQYEQAGGNAVDFVRKFMGKTFVDAVEFLLQYNGEPLPDRPQQKREPFSLPEANSNMKRIFAYLVNQRGIDREVLYAFVHKRMVFESAKHHNAVFVGYDREGVPRHAHKRSTASEGTYKCNATGSLPEYSFHWAGTDNELYLFEAPIDLLSYITLHQQGWRAHSYAAACSVSDKVMFQMLTDYPTIKMAYICFDSDEPGQTAAQRISDKLFLRGIKSEILVPIHKDWNEDLVSIRRAET